MDSSLYRVRRATVDDLPQLRALWQAMGITEPDLDKRLTEFQVAVSTDGELIGALALRVAESQGLILHEAFTDFAVADSVRPLLWERMQAVATNHGLVRIWTREDAPFWSRCGLNPASPEALAKLPAPWQAKEARWLVFQRREEITGTDSVEKQFEMFMQAEKQRTQSALEQAKMLKTIATAIAIILAVAVIGAAVYLLRKNPLLLGR
jgi:N-acetylglutamate synthase-like GNAT family acetyltransferase